MNLVYKIDFNVIILYTTMPESDSKSLSDHEYVNIFSEKMNEKKSLETPEIKSVDFEYQF